MIKDRETEFLRMLRTKTMDLIILSQDRLDGQRRRDPEKEKQDELFGRAAASDDSSVLDDMTR